MSTVQNTEPRYKYTKNWEIQTEEFYFLDREIFVPLYLLIFMKVASFRIFLKLLLNKNHIKLH